MSASYCQSTTLRAPLTQSLLICSLLGAVVVTAGCGYSSDDDDGSRFDTDVLDADADDDAESDAEVDADDDVTVDTETDTTDDAQSDIEPDGCSGEDCPIACPTDLVECNGQCVDILTSRSHCGTCNAVCIAGDICVDGACTLNCQPSLTDCGGDCVDLQSSRPHCGACDASCADDMVCGGGECMTICPSGTTECGGSCVDTINNPNHCGTCDQQCETGETVEFSYCAAGVCSTTLCEPGLLDCDGLQGCETDVETDTNNCGACGNICGASAPYCTQGVCSQFLNFEGVQTDMPVATLAGWTECFSNRYADTTPLVDLLLDCNGSRLLLACRSVDTPDILTVAAQAPRSDVLFDTGGLSIPHNANGVGWYFSGSSAAMGFAPEGATIRLASCDTEGPFDADRMCWHKLNDDLSPGYRCGNTFLNDSTTWERVVYEVP